MSAACQGASGAGGLRGPELVGLAPSPNIVPSGQLVSQRRNSASGKKRPLRLRSTKCDLGSLPSFAPNYNAIHPESSNGEPSNVCSATSWQDSTIGKNIIDYHQRTWNEEESRTVELVAGRSASTNKNGLCSTQRVKLRHIEVKPGSRGRHVHARLSVGSRDRSTDR